MCAATWPRLSSWRTRSWAQVGQLHFTLFLLASIVLAGRVGLHLAVHWGQAATVGKIIVGIALGFILFGWLFRGAFDYVFRSASYGPMHILQQLGLILLMFQIGMEFEFTHLKARKHHQSVVRIAIASMVVPFAAGYALGYGMTPVLSPGGPVHRQGIFDHGPAHSAAHAD